MKSVNIPDIAITRLSLYARNLALLDEKGAEMVSSARLADICGVNPAQIRKDLAYFGEFGTRGLGYYVKELLYEIRRILGLEKEWRLALVGVGSLGAALLRDAEFLNQGYVFVAAFERDPERIGMQVGDVTVASLEAMNPLIQEKGVELGVIAVSPPWAQEAADRLVDAGVYGMLNFAPVQLQCPSDVHIQNVDLALKLDVLSYKLTSPLSR
jgi:redox-sensing transcriptional repressor